MVAIPKDENFKTALFGVSSLDNETPVPIAVNPENGFVKMEIVTPKLSENAASESTIKDLINEIKIMNKHLSEMTGEQFTKEDVESEVM